MEGYYSNHWGRRQGARKKKERDFPINNYLFSGEMEMVLFS
jgi:hypothetical protein